MANTRTPEQEKKTQDELFLVAARTFLRDGYEATSMKSLAEEAGCTTGKYYSNFSGKQEILHRLLDTLLQRHSADAVKMGKKKRAPQYAVAVFLSMILKDTLLYDNLKEIYSAGFREREAQELVIGLLRELSGAAGEGAAEKLRLKVAAGAIPAFFTVEELSAEETESIFLEMLLSMLGFRGDSIAEYVRMTREDSSVIRELAYDSIVKLLFGHKKFTK